jgi:hypothetical protein
MDHWIYILGSPVYLYFLFKLNIILIKAAYSIYHSNTIKNKIDNIYIGMKESEGRLDLFSNHPNWYVGQLSKTLMDTYLFKSPSLIPRYNELRKVYNFVMNSEVISEFYKNEMAIIFLHKGIITKNGDGKLPYQVKVNL